MVRLPAVEEVRVHLGRFEAKAILFTSLCLRKISLAGKWEKPVIDLLTLQKDTLK